MQYAPFRATSSTLRVWEPSVWRPAEPLAPAAASKCLCGGGDRSGSHHHLGPMSGGSDALNLVAQAELRGRLQQPGRGDFDAGVIAALTGDALEAEGVGGAGQIENAGHRILFMIEILKPYCGVGD